MINSSVACAALALLTGPTSAVSLVKDGWPIGEFVLPDPAAGAEEFATSDVQYWIEQITGATVPILKAPSRQANTKILVAAALANDFPEDLAKLEGNDGFAARRRRSKICVSGSRLRGTLYGLYALVEENTELNFARPHVGRSAAEGLSPAFTPTGHRTGRTDGSSGSNNRHLQ